MTTKMPLYQDEVLLNLSEQQDKAAQAQHERLAELKEIEGQLKRHQHIETIADHAEFQRLENLQAKAKTLYEQAKIAYNDIRAKINKRHAWLASSAGQSYTRIAQVRHKQKHGETLSVEEQIILTR